MLEIPTVVVTDNDGNVDALKRKYLDYCGLDNIEIFYDHRGIQILEPQLLKYNDLDTPEL